jgi:hypothetical protein
VDSMRARRDSVVGGTWIALEMRGQAAASGGTRVFVVVDRSNQVIRRADGRLRERFSGGRAMFEFDIGQRSSGWVLTDLRRSGT